MIHDALWTTSYSTPSINTIAGRTVRTTYGMGHTHSLSSPAATYYCTTTPRTNFLGT